jgi:hypothetical protein
MFFKKRKEPRGAESQRDTEANRRPMTAEEKKKVEQVRNDEVIYDRFEATDN